ncbi:tetraacyldisaccharide 4'-kinase [Microvirga sp. STR05]|uniref:Tetraacyldisaccharide 4'-kinase n=1 Tax=Hymenobacter duratus TaxID=2771356 RepID=A0ABR8JLH2_9BACT|nr:tetraacyldisaccharide 4'-kinase [Hymenobacter duratus]MBD2716576.1 tetraacyldisaccharide 4'-kinase [Hymenobacter duratus]MBR7951491.1 tetraacyldisaccharide 4'-kinase [Microvirga sp. STR05]
MSGLLSFLLMPLAWLYAGVMAVRNWLYDTGRKSSGNFWPVPVLSVGNLRVGGTGKTPHVAWLVRELLSRGQHPAILSRGYGRRTRGYRLGSPQETAETFGDEPLQYYQDFKEQVPVAVCEDRLTGLSRLFAQPQVGTVVLDDAFQHRRVQPDFSILLTEQHRPFYEDYVLPAGRLRENRTGARRADAVIVTKCDADLSVARQQEIEQRVRRYARPGVPVLFSTYAYSEPVPLAGSAAKTGTCGPEIVLLTGIAQPGPLRDYLMAAGYHIVHHADFPDHHAFTPAEIAGVAAHCGPGRCIFTTQKDATRLLAPALHTEIARLPVFYIPVTVKFLADGAARLRQLLPAALKPQAVV